MKKSAIVFLFLAIVQTTISLESNRKQVYLPHPHHLQTSKPYYQKSKISQNTNAFIPVTQNGQIIGYSPRWNMLENQGTAEWDDYNIKDITVNGKRQGSTTTNFNWQKKWGNGRLAKSLKKMVKHMIHNVRKMKGLRYVLRSAKGQQIYWPHPNTFDLNKPWVEKSETVSQNTNAFAPVANNKGQFVGYSSRHNWHESPTANYSANQQVAKRDTANSGTTWTDGPMLNKDLNGGVISRFGQSKKSTKKSAKKSSKKSKQIYYPHPNTFDAAKPFVETEKTTSQATNAFAPTTDDKGNFVGYRSRHFWHEAPLANSTADGLKAKKDLANSGTKWEEGHFLDKDVSGGVISRFGKSKKSSKKSTKKQIYYPHPNTFDASKPFVESEATQSQATNAFGATTDDKGKFVGYRSRHFWHEAPLANSSYTSRKSKLDLANSGTKWEEGHFLDKDVSGGVISRFGKSKKSTKKSTKKSSKKQIYYPHPNTFDASKPFVETEATQSQATNAFGATTDDKGKFVGYRSRHFWHEAPLSNSTYTTRKSKLDLANSGTKWEEGHFLDKDVNGGVISF